MGDFGTFLRLKRSKAGLGKRRFGISPTAIYYLESGRNHPTYTSLVELAKAFNMPTWKFIKEFETGKP